MKLWGGRFTKEENQLVHNFNASITFDQKFYHQDIQGSIAHVTMLAKQAIITDAERDIIISALKEICSDIESGKLQITEEYEDIHSFVESVLIERTGDTGKKLHTGRSRNDQVALDMKLYTRDEVLATNELVKELMTTLLDLMKEHTILICRALHICRKHSLLHWLTTSVLTSKCSSVTVQDSMTFMSV